MDVRETTERIGFKVPDNLKYFTSVQYSRWIVVIGGLNTYLETPVFDSQGRNKGAEEQQL